MRRALFVLCVLAGCSGAGRDEVVVYTSVDEIYAREIFAAFTRETGVTVRAVFDTEEAKTLGLVNRIAAERAAPQADVFWNGECSRTAWLKSQGLLEPFRPASAAGIADEWRDADGAWTGFGARARVIVYHTSKTPPRTLDELASGKWRVAVANPLFGTTAAHAVAMGEDEALRVFRALKSGGARFVGGNSHVRDLVARGECDAGLTDTDDVWIGRQRGDPIDMVLPEPTLVIPNSVALVKGAPRPAAARRFIEWLLRPETEAMLAKGPSRQIPVRGDALPAKRLRIDWGRVTASDEFFRKLRGALDL